jgi:hypothetical protein
MRRVYKMSLNSGKSNESNTISDFSNSKEPCHICKSRGAFICEHDTVVRDNLKNNYAEDGRYYMSARNLSRSEQYSESLRNGSAINSAGSRQTYYDSKLLMNGNKKTYPKLFLSTPKKNSTYDRNGYLTKQKSQQQTTVKKSQGCCSIS